MATKIKQEADMETKKVTMGLTKRDIANTEVLVERMHARNKASVVSNALALTALLTERTAEGDELLLRKKDGRMERWSEFLLPTCEYPIDE